MNAVKRDRHDVIVTYERKLNRFTFYLLKSVTVSYIISNIGLILFDHVLTKNDLAFHSLNLFINNYTKM